MCVKLALLSAGSPVAHIRTTLISARARWLSLLDAWRRFHHDLTVGREK